MKKIMIALMMVLSSNSFAAADDFDLSEYASRGLFNELEERAGNKNNLGVSYDQSDVDSEGNMTYTVKTGSESVVCKQKVKKSSGDIINTICSIKK